MRDPPLIPGIVQQTSNVQCMADGPLGRYKDVATRLDVKPELPFDRAAARILGQEMAVGRVSVDRIAGKRV